MVSSQIQLSAVKAGVHMNAIFSPLNVGLMKISRSRFKQSKNPLLISRSYVVACFVNFWVIFGYIWVEIVFLKGLEKFREIRKNEDLMKLVSWVSPVCWCSKNHFPSSIPSFNLFKFHSNSRLPNS